MRKAFTKVALDKASSSRNYFITGDLGFMAFEDVREQYGTRFINAGVSEQNMIGVAAGLAREGMLPIVYSIAPFCYARPFEQIRNDICMPNLPVCLVGNGGGYAYGHMGPTHHALEDCAVLNSIGVRVVVPAFDSDIAQVCHSILSPTYIRLGLDQMPPSSSYQPYQPWRKILSGKKGVMVVLGPLIGNAWHALTTLTDLERPSLWCVCEFDEKLIPKQFISEVDANTLYVLEEHVQSGGLAMNVALYLAKNSIKLTKLVSASAVGYPTKTYGSQEFHRRQSGLDHGSIAELIKHG